MRSPSQQSPFRASTPHSGHPAYTVQYDSQCVITPHHLLYSMTPNVRSPQVIYCTVRLPMCGHPMSHTVQYDSQCAVTPCLILYSTTPNHWQCAFSPSDLLYSPTPNVWAPHVSYCTVRLPMCGHSMSYTVQYDSQCVDTPCLVLYSTTSSVRSPYVFRDSTASGNQGKLEGIFPVKEKSGNFAFFKNRRNLMIQFFFYILMTQYIFMAVRGGLLLGV